MANSPQFELSAPVMQVLQGLTELMQEGEQDLQGIQERFREVLARYPAPELPPGTASEEAASALVEQSYDEEDPTRVAEMLVGALRLDPANVHALTLLGNDAATSFPELGLFLLTLAVVNGQEQLGQQYFQERVGEFWQREETRPFMQALQGLATVCWDIGDMETAARHFAMMLDLNPQDDQLARQGLLSIFLEAKMTAGAEQLLASYPDDQSLFWKYGRVLHELQANGPKSPRARDLLGEARNANASVIDFLTGARQLDQEVGDTEVEPHITALMLGDAWQGTPGAVDFLKQSQGEATALAKPPAKEKRSGPRSID